MELSMSAKLMQAFRQRPMDRLKCLLAPTLLSLVATLQLILVHTASLSRWEGGGFGMYSELPPHSRHVEIDADDSPVHLRLPAEATSALERRIDRFKVIPSERNLESIAALLREHAVAPFRIEAWAERYDLDRQKLVRVRIGEIIQSPKPE